MWKRRAYSLVQQHESWQIPQLLSFLIRWFIFTKQVIVLFWDIFYSYLQKFFKTGVLLKTLHKTSDMDVFLWILRNCQVHHFYRLLWDSCFCVYCNITKFSVFTKVAFPTIWDTHKYWNVYTWNQNYVNVRIYSLSSLLIL